MQYNSKCICYKSLWSLTDLCDSLSPTLSTFSLLHTHTHTRACTHVHVHTHTHTQSHSHSLTVWLESLQLNLSSNISVCSFDPPGEEVMRIETYFEMFWLAEEIKWDQSFCPSVSNLNPDKQESKGDEGRHFLSYCCKHLGISLHTLLCACQQPSWITPLSRALSCPHSGKEIPLRSWEDMANVDLLLSIFRIREIAKMTFKYLSFKRISSWRH